MGLNPNAPQFVPGAKRNFYFHVTKEENLPGICKEGLQPKYGGGAAGMSNLRLKAQAEHEELSQTFVEGSKNKVHLTKRWAAVVRYAHHSLILTQKLFPDPAFELHGEDYAFDSIPLGKLPVILRCQLWGDPYLDHDKDDPEGRTTTQQIKPDVICIAVEPRAAEGREVW